MHVKISLDSQSLTKALIKKTMPLRIKKTRTSATTNKQKCEQIVISVRKRTTSFSTIQPIHCKPAVLLGTARTFYGFSKLLLMFIHPCIGKSLFYQVQSSVPRKSTCRLHYSRTSGLLLSNVLALTVLSGTKEYK